MSLPPTHASPRGSRVSRARPALFSLLLVAAASSCGGASASSPPSTPKAATPGDVIQWALGSDRRGNYPPRAGVYLLLLPLGQGIDSGKRLGAACHKTASILPAPAGDPRLFAVIRGALHAFPTPEAEPVSLEGNDPSLKVTRLLAIRNASSPLQILVAAQASGASVEQIFSMSVGEKAILRVEPLSERAMPPSASSFFASYASPRCLSGGKRCLGLGDDGQRSYIEEEATRDAPRTPVGPSEGIPNLVDIAWAPSQAGMVYLLVGC